MIKTYETLYARSNAAGKLLIWYMEQEGDKYRTIAGTDLGEKTTSAWTTALPKNTGKKNESSGEEQAELEVKAKYKKKLKGKYHQDAKDVDTKRFTQPMLAEKLPKYKAKLVYPVLVQLKYNGFRCIAESDGTWTRRGEKYLTIPHIEKVLADLFVKYPDLVLDGELYNYSLRQQLNKISELVRRTTDVTQADLDASEKIVQYHVYDGYGFNGITEETPYIDRITALLALLDDMEYIHVVVGEVAETFDEIETIFTEYIDDGQEGIIVRAPSSPYEHKRSKHLLKYKPTDDAEFEIVSVEEGTGNWAGVAKIIGLKMDDGKVFNGTFKGTREQAADMLANKADYIGKRATCFYNGFTGLGTPNNAQFDYSNWHNDKSAKEED